MWSVKFVFFFHCSEAVAPIVLELEDEDDDQDGLVIEIDDEPIHDQPDQQARFV